MRIGSAVATLERVSTAEAYVAALDQSLVGPRRVRRGLVQEARDHLDDASTSLSGPGTTAPRRSGSRCADFGSLDQIVPAFQTTLAVAASRRTALMLFAVLAIQPFLWDGPTGAGQRPAPGRPVLHVLDRGVEYGGGLMILTSLALLVAPPGSATDGSHAGRGIARLTSFTTIGAAVSMKLTAVAMVLLSSAGSPVAWLMVAASSWSR